MTRSWCTHQAVDHTPLAELVYVGKGGCHIWGGGAHLAPDDCGHLPHQNAVLSQIGIQLSQDIGCLHVCLRKVVAVHKCGLQSRCKLQASECTEGKQHADASEEQACLQGQQGGRFDSGVGRIGCW